MQSLRYRASRVNSNLTWCPKQKPASLSNKLYPTWRFMGSYKWGYKSLIWVTSIVTLLITTHEPLSRVGLTGGLTSPIGLENHLSQARPPAPWICYSQDHPICLGTRLGTAGLARSILSLLMRTTAHILIWLYYYCYWHEIFLLLPCGLNQSTLSTL